MLEQKADVSDLEKLVGILEGKLDLARFDELTQEMKHSQLFVERGEF